MADFYIRSAKTIAQSECRQIGVVLGEDNFEYPLWALLADKMKVMPEIRHEKVGNASAGLRDFEFNPCLVLINRKSAQALEQVTKVR